MGIEGQGGGNEALKAPGLDARPEKARVPPVYTVEVPDRDRAALFVAGAINQRFDAKLQTAVLTSWASGRAKEARGPP